MTTNATDNTCFKFLCGQCGADNDTETLPCVRCGDAVSARVRAVSVTCVPAGVIKTERGYTMQKWTLKIKKDPAS